jgi:hypothetical protein
MNQQLSYGAQAEDRIQIDSHGMALLRDRRRLSIPLRADLRIGDTDSGLHGTHLDTGRA